MIMRNENEAGRVLFIHSVVCFCFIALAAFYFSVGFPAQPAIEPGCIATAALVLWILGSWYAVTGYGFDLYLIFIVATAGFNCGQIFLQIFGLNSNGLLQSKFSDTTLWQTILFICVALSTLHFGALWKLFFKSSVNPNWPAQRRHPPARPELLKVGLFLTLVSLVPTYLVVRNLIEVVRSSGYFGIYQQVDQIGFDNSLSLIASFFVPGLLFTLAGAKHKPALRRLATAGLILHALIFTIMGRRGDGAETLLSFAFVRHYCIAPIQKRILIPAMLFFLIVVFPLIAAVRNLNLDRRADLSVLAKAYQTIEHPEAAAVSEMGGSMQAISYTIDLVPTLRPYDLGASYYYSLLSVVPNFFWKLHPSVARGSPSIWLVKTVEPDIAEKGGGLGFSYLAEAYLNFGWWGAPIFLFIFGYAVCWFTDWSEFSGDPSRIAMAASFFASLLTFARADSQSVVRPFIWYALLPYVMVKLFEAFTKPASRLID